MKSVKERKSLVNHTSFGKPKAQLLNSIPSLGFGLDFKTFIKEWNKAEHVTVLIGAHVVKQGLSPFINEWIKSGKVKHVCMNGATAIHDLEIGLIGKTSESVEHGLKTGCFGMWKETGNLLNNKISPVGLGFSLARRSRCLQHRNKSLLFHCYKQDITCSVHVAFGTDIVHMHPNFNPAIIGKATHNDFLLLKDVLKTTDMVVLFGSAVIMPEVFLKALNLARYEGSKNKPFVAVFDMQHQYRAYNNIVARTGLNGVFIIGSHELTIPLIHEVTKIGGRIK